MSRAWLAALLAFVYPGLGHVYLRAWLRALAWFGLAISTVVWLVVVGVVPASAFTSFERGGIEGVLAASRSLPTEAHAAVFLVTAFNVVDAYFIAKRRTSGDGDAESCPECGQDLDDDLDFCPWCTERLEPESEAEPTSR